MVNITCLQVDRQESQSIRSQARSRQVKAGLGPNRLGSVGSKVREDYINGLSINTYKVGRKLKVPPESDSPAFWYDQPLDM